MSRLDDQATSWMGLIHSICMLLTVKNKVGAVFGVSVNCVCLKGSRPQGVTEQEHNWPRSALHQAFYFLFQRARVSTVCVKGLDAYSASFEHRRKKTLRQKYNERISSPFFPWLLHGFGSRASAFICSGTSGPSYGLHDSSPFYHPSVFHIHPLPIPPFHFMTLEPSAG